MKTNQKDIYKHVDLNDDETQDKIIHKFLNGLPHADTHGHSVKVQFRVSEASIYPIENLRSSCPKSMFKSDSDLHRRIYAVGAYVACKMCKCIASEAEIDKIIADLEKIDVVAKAIRYEELTKDYAYAEKNLESYLKDGETDIEKLLDTIKKKSSFKLIRKK